MSDEVRIVDVVQESDVQKWPEPKIGYGVFGANVHYVLEDGQKIATTISRSRKKDVMPAITDALEAAMSGRMMASFQDGRFIGTSTSYWIGPKERNPYL